MQNPISYPASMDLLMKTLDAAGSGIIITDPDQQDNPIIYANKGFSHVTGYETEEIIGFNCRFLQGPDTSEAEVDKLRRAIQELSAVSVQIVNYKKDGTPFWNDLHMEPIYIEEEEKYYFAGVQKDITKQRSAEDKAADYNKEIQLLSAPIIPIADDIFALPVIGNVNEERMRIIFDQTTETIHSSKVSILILDLSGLTSLDEETMKGLFGLYHLVRLLGSELVITGISPQLAMKSASMNARIGSIRIFSTIKDAVKVLQNNV
ncbi:PAS domain-containing protein [Salibacterium halotolerans]|uniref:PAS domain S-box-containing protein n=1 Tax=Salibacterium halotolerans TaxID=1884432 RepID=A0A1I5RNC2_9BACI|nr:PAS domain-containing protein [Salibacterium halotolerans]SFP60035.1 PAS domain S-box-containing protein [Salibacterium halotolerans]